MSESLRERLFREPEGPSKGLVWISFAIVFFGLHLYSDALEDSASGLWLVLGVLFVLIAVPELLPSEYQYVAGVLRTVAIAIAVLVLLYNSIVF